MKISDNIPLVSIIVPVFNLQKYLRSCLDSILLQSYGNIEIILIDDGSSDGSSETCDKYAKNDKRIKVIHQKNQGVSAARNNGLKKAKGEYITFIDGDDLVSPIFISTLLEEILSSSAQAVSCASTHNLDEMISIEDNKHRRLSFDGESAIINTLYQKEISNGPHAKLFLKSRIEGQYFLEDLKVAEDLEYNCRVFNKCDRVQYLDAPLYFYRKHKDSTLGSSFKSKRMDEIKASAIIKNQYPSAEIKRAATNRLFMSAIFVLSSMGHMEEHKKASERCFSVMNKYKTEVFLDSGSKTRYRIFALIAFLSPQLVVRTIKSKQKIFNRLKEKI